MVVVPCVGGWECWRQDSHVCQTDGHATSPCVQVTTSQMSQGGPARGKAGGGTGKQASLTVGSNDCQGEREQTLTHP